jgi:hypothetical protein
MAWIIVLCRGYLVISHRARDTVSLAGPICASTSILRGHEGCAPTNWPHRSRLGCFSAAPSATFAYP